MNDEGPAFYTSNAIVAGLSPVHRFYNTQTGVHFFTISEGERAKVAADLPQYTYEGIAYYASQVAGSGLTPLYRFYYASKGFHFFTSNIAERDNIIATLPNYKYEGVGYYVMNSDWQGPGALILNAPTHVSLDQIDLRKNTDLTQANIKIFFTDTSGVTEEFGPIPGLALRYSTPVQITQRRGKLQVKTDGVVTHQADLTLDPIQINDAPGAVSLEFLRATSDNLSTALAAIKKDDAKHPTVINADSKNAFEDLTKRKEFITASIAQIKAVQLAGSVNITTSADGKVVYKLITDDIKRMDQSIARLLHENTKRQATVAPVTTTPAIRLLADVRVLSMAATVSSTDNPLLQFDPFKSVGKSKYVDQAYLDSTNMMNNFERAANYAMAATTAVSGVATVGLLVAAGVTGAAVTSPVWVTGLVAATVYAAAAANVASIGVKYYYDEPPGYSSKEEHKNLLGLSVGQLLSPQIKTFGESVSQSVRSAQFFGETGYSGVVMAGAATLSSAAWKKGLLVIPCGI